jgi:hypothetical protein
MREQIRDAPAAGVLRAETTTPGRPKIGAGALAAMGRQGLNELRAAVMPDSNIAQPTEAGAIGTATPGEVSQARAAEPMTPGVFGQSTQRLGDRIAQMYGRSDASRDNPNRENLSRDNATRESSPPTPAREPREPDME